MKTKLGIRFADNDFYNTLHGFFRTVADGVMWNRHDVAGKLTKQRVVDLFNNLAYPLYLLYQNREAEDYNSFDSVAKWVIITEKDVYLDEEVDAYLDYLRETRCGNGEFQYFDLEATLQGEMTGQKLEPVIVVI